MNPDTLACQALLNCLIREVSAPEEQAWEDDGHLLIRLARSGAELRAGLRRRPAGIAPRPAGWVQLRRGASWQTIGWQRLADLVADELTLATGVANPEFGAQVRDSHASVTAILAARAGRPATPQAGPGGTGPQAGPGGTGPQAGPGGTGPQAGPGGTGPQAGPGGTGPQAGPGGTGQDRIGRYLASEQALIAGHRFHPSPKARQGAPRDWLRYAPEAGAGFPLRFLGVRDEVLAAEGDCTGLDRLGAPVPPPGYRVLPAHPWQFRLLAGQPWLRDALRRGLVVDLGDGSREVAATSSVRTVYDPGADVFCKFSLNVRITNCVRKSAWYELAGAVALTRLLRPVFAELASRFGGTVLLGEPGYRTAALSARDAYEGLAVIVRDGVRAATAPDVTPLLAASLTEPAPGLFDGRERDWLLAWWQAYVRAVAPPVLGAFFWHGVVLEPHLQNVLIGVDGAGWPVQAIFRDLEGTKLVASRHAALLAGLAPGIARGLAYDDRRGWDRVAYCLLVNHLSEVAAAIADRQLGKPAWEHELWRRARQVLTDAAAEHGWPPQLRAVLAGVPLPAKANLRLRWARDDAGPRAMGGLPAYVYDLTALDAHAARIRAALPRTTELYYAVKANPDAAVLRTIARHADGFEVSSGGELEHANAAVPGQPRAFGGPGKTAAELAAALRVGVTRFHVESPLELSMLAAAAQAAGVRADILLRVNPPGPAPGASAAGPAGGSSPGELAALVMGEQPSPFGMDLVLLDRCAETLARLGNGPLRLRGLHAHLASGLDAAGLLAAAGRLLAFGRDWCARHHVTDPEFNLGGGMAVDYRRPEVRFDWDAYGRGLARLARPGETLRIEPGRAVTAYCGWYLTRVLDVKHSHGQAFAVVAGGTHHLRTPAAKGHDQPFAVVPVPDWAPSWPRPGVTGTAVTITGQLCTPKDVLARQVTVPRLRAGDVVAFGLAGAYAWNISHHGFLMHPPPAFHYLPQLA